MKSVIVYLAVADVLLAGVSPRAASCAVARYGGDFASGRAAAPLSLGPTPIIMGAALTPTAGPAGLNYSGYFGGSASPVPGHAVRPAPAIVSAQPLSVPSRETLAPALPASEVGVVGGRSVVFDDRKTSTLIGYLGELGSGVARHLAGGNFSQAASGLNGIFGESSRAWSGGVAPGVGVLPANLRSGSASGVGRVRAFQKRMIRDFYGPNPRSDEEYVLTGITSIEVTPPVDRFSDGGLRLEGVGVLGLSRAGIKSALRLKLMLAQRGYRPMTLKIRVMRSIDGRAYAYDLDVADSPSNRVRAFKKRMIADFYGPKPVTEKEYVLSGITSIEVTPPVDKFADGGLYLEGVGVLDVGPWGIKAALRLKEILAQRGFRPLTLRVRVLCSGDGRPYAYGLELVDD